MEHRCYAIAYSVDIRDVTEILPVKPKFRQFNSIAKQNLKVGLKN